MSTVVTRTLQILAALTALSAQTIQTASAKNTSPHRCAGTYALDQTQDDLRKRLAAVVCAQPDCLCESFTPLNTEISKLLALNKRLTEEDMKSLQAVILKNPTDLIAQAPECKSAPLHLLLSARKQFGCLHKDGFYLNHNIEIVMLALFNAHNDGKKFYSRQKLLNLQDTTLRTPVDISEEIAELKHIKDLMHKALEESALVHFWHRYNQERKERNKERKRLALTNTALTEKSDS